MFKSAADEIPRIFGDAEVRYVEGMGMMDAACRSGLLLKLNSYLWISGQLGSQHFQGDFFVNDDMSGAVDVAHSARAQPFFDSILVRKDSA
ncbi:MAG TPA: hypothetical protein VGQ81_06625 [Acidobacteriota bacterium]|nr:hypothetical protein [Acidobacteriota bacterium]